jgi:hypothetical protein
MKLSRTPLVLVLTMSSLTACLSSGCQSTIGGQTLPSAYYLRDDIQYFPPGPENRLTNQRKAIADYNASKAQLQSDLAAPPPVE